MWLSFLLLIASLALSIHSLAPTDEVQDADPSQSGYLDNHNMHPATVGSPIFGILWKNTYTSKERWYAKPLVYTPPGGSQLVFLASSMNVLRTLDAVNGTLLNTRTVMPPFLQSDIGCTDIPDFIGIIGTPIIDPSTNTAYFFAKGYKGEATGGGVANGIYKFYAVDVVTLQDRPGFPVLVDGNFADNDHQRYFIGGTVLQRPSLTLINGVVIGGFGGHCDLFNYTGMLVAVSTTPGVGVKSLFAMESSPGAPPVVSDITIQKGGKAGIWQSGMALSTDGSRLFLATGNGIGHENGDVPASGRTPLSTLDEVVANFAVSASGVITLTDYFEPYEYISMDAGDRDLGSGGVALLDPNIFNGPGVSKIAVTIGKNGKAYIMNANNLGGFKQAPGGVDNVIQTIPAAGSVFGGAGSYPLEGGYIYFTPVGAPTVCYKFGKTVQGNIQFSLVGQTSTNSAGRVGIGIPTVTTYKGQAGTGILWISDLNVGLQAFNAVPVGGVLTPISLPATGGLNKFQRPAFGDGRLYVTDSKGNVFCLGSPVALPLQCSQPVNFGDVAIGTASTQIVNCTALIPLASVNGCTTGDPTWHCFNSTLPKGPLAKGAIFSFPITWNLTQESINDAQNASFGKVLPGVASTALNIYTTNAVPQYSNLLPISLLGTTISQSAFLTISPPEVDLGGIVVGSAGATSGLSGSASISNVGATTLIFLGSAWTKSVDIGDGDIEYTNITDGALGEGFTSSSLPQVGDTLTPGQSLTIPLGFKANQTGAYSTFLQLWTTGGNGYLLITASASTAPIANISISTIEGGWNGFEPIAMNFGDVLAGTTVSKYIRICNAGGSILTVTKSKPPIQSELLAPNAGTDLHEAQTIDPNTCALGQVSIVAAPLGVNRFDHTVSDIWTLNTDDITFGVREVPVMANIVTRQVGPLLSNGSSEYVYLGCYFDGDGRLLAKQYKPNDNENGVCQQTCFNTGYTFAGTEYHTECWCGNRAPTYLRYSDPALKKCAFSCPGDVTQACGGDGTFVSIYYDRLKYIPGPDSIPGAPVPSSSSSSSTPVTTAPTSASTLSTSISSSTSSSSSSTPTGPAIVMSIGAYNYVGCYTEATTGRALSGKSYANDNMTVEICYATCTGFTWFGIEYHRECYCGNTVNAGSALSTSGNTCSHVCQGNPLQYCGGSSRLSMYNNLAGKISSSSVVATTSTISSSSSIVVSTDSATSSSSSSVSTTTSETSSSSSSTISTDSDTSSSSSSHISSSSTSSSISSTLTTSSTVPTTTSTSTLITSTSTSTTSSTTPAITTTSTSSPSTSTSTPTPTSTSTAILGFASVGCFDDPVGGPFGGHNMPKLFSNDSMSPSLCISSALARLFSKPATTFLYAGVEYGRECYAATAAPSPEPRSVVGMKACTIPCAGDAKLKCGGGKMYNLYAATSVTVTGTGSGQWSTPPATVTTT